MIQRLSGAIAHRAWAFVVIGIFLVVVSALYGSGVFGSLANGGFDDPATESSRELALEQQTFGNLNADVIAIYSSPTLKATDPAFEAAVRASLAAVPQSDLTSVSTYYDTHSPSLLSTDGHATAVVMSLAGQGQGDKATAWTAVKGALSSDTLTLDLAGAYPVYGDVSKITEQDLKRAELVSAPLVVLLSLLIFGSVVASLMPVMVGLVTVVGSLAALRIIAGYTDISVFAVNAITLIGMGMAIDYGLFIITRFREELGRLPDDTPDAAAAAIRITMNTAGRTVLFSGLTVAASMSSLLVFPQTFLRSLGFGAITAVLLAMVTSLTLLPAVLRLFGRRVDVGRMPWRRNRPVLTDTDHGAWARLAHVVMGRPVLIIVGVTAVLFLVASPFLGVRWGSVDYRVLPQSAPSYQATEKLNREFGQETSTANIMVTGGDQQAVTQYAGALGQVSGVVAVTPMASKGDQTLVRVTWDGNSQTGQSQQLVNDLRAVPRPPGVQSLVGGQTAATVDLIGSIRDHLPWMALIVVSVMFVLLFLAFGSLILPIKAVVMNALSISASFGVVTWIFADGHLSGLLGFSPEGYLDVTQPVFMLAILFGLSMDYEVFLLSRIREQWDQGSDNATAVAVGLQKTGRIITSAALLLAVVIGAFGFSGIVMMKMIGVGMLVALLVDATVVRALLVPAAMKLLGRLNWWAPGPMRRWWERYGLPERTS